MLLLFVFLVLCGNCYGEHSIKCGEKGGWSFEESRDGVEGRYELEWCTQRYYKGWSEWSIDLYYDHTQSPNKCHSSSQHSLVREIVNIELENCTVACLSTSIDLIFNGTCYSVVTEFSRQKPNSKNAREKCCVETYTKFVLNNYSMNHFTDSKAVVNVYSSWNHVVAEWFLGYIPATDYTMKVCLDTESFECEELNCTVEGAGRTQLRCPLVPPRGAYELRLAHRAPWAAGALFENVARVLHRSNVRVANSSLPWTGVEAGRGAWGGAALWGAVAALLLAASGALLAAARRQRPRLAAKLRERHKRREDAAGEGREGGVRERGEREERGRVLLLYARDCAPLLDVVSCLTALLEAAGFQVWDLYAARTARLYAAAPAGWLAAALARRGVRVLLLQTPAAACLCSAHLHHSGRLQQPLLNRRVMYRVPHAGDDLFLLALRLVASSALAAPDYRKHYVASIDSLEVEMVRDVTPLQRYVLPAAAALLLHHLQLPAATDTPASPAPPAPPSPPPAPDSGELPDTAPLAAPDTAPLAAPDTAPLVAPAAPRPHEPPPALLPHISALTEAVKRLHDYVRQKPDYLDEELIFFD